MRGGKRSERSTNYCHSLLRAKRGSRGWNRGLRGDSWCWNDNNGWINNLSFSPALERYPHPPTPTPLSSHPSFLTQALFSLHPSSSIVFFSFPVQRRSRGTSIVPPHHLFFSLPSLIYFNLSCLSLLPQCKRLAGRLKVWGGDVGKSEGRWAKKLVSALLP